MCLALTISSISSYYLHFCHIYFCEIFVDEVFKTSFAFFFLIFCNCKLRRLSIWLFLFHFKDMIVCIKTLYYKIKLLKLRKSLSSAMRQKVDYTITTKTQRFNIKKIRFQHFVFVHSYLKNCLILDFPYSTKYL